MTYRSRDERVKLRRCPFCGGEGRLRSDYMMIRKESQKCAWVYCRRCNARTNYYLRKDAPEDYIEYAIDAWNMRDS